MSYTDPLIPYLKFDHFNLKSEPVDEETLSGVDCALLVTDHSGFDYEFILKHAKVIFDTRNAYKGIKSEK